MPPTRNTSSRNRKKARVKVLEDKPYPTISASHDRNSPSTFVRNFAVRRLASGHKSQRRAKVIPLHNDTSSTTVVDDDGADDDIAIIEPTTCEMDDEHGTTPVTAPRQNRGKTAQKKDNSASVRFIYSPVCIRSTARPAEKNFHLARSSRLDS